MTTTTTTTTTTTNDLIVDAGAACLGHWTGGDAEYRRYRALAAAAQRTVLRGLTSAPVDDVDDRAIEKALVRLLAGVEISPAARDALLAMRADDAAIAARVS